MMGSRPDLACIVSQYLEKPKATHIKLVQRVLGYLSVNRDVPLVYKPAAEKLPLKDM